MLKHREFLGKSIFLVHKLALALLVFFCLVPTQVLAWENLDIQAELRRPGVKLLVVEFYADWCPPCKKAVPLWNELHEEYKDRGLRLIVVSVGSAGSCVNPGWVPDKVVCDLEGTIQESWGARELPQAFLFSWQGNMLVGHAGYEAVDKAVQRYFKRTPRILVSDPVDEQNRPLKDGAALKEVVRGKMTELAKFEMVAGDKEMAELRKLRKKGRQVEANSGESCELGKEVSANSELKTILVTYGSEKTLVLQLFSVETGCVVARSEARVGSGGMSAAVFEAVLALLEKMVGGVKEQSGPPVNRGELSGSGTAVTYVPSGGEDVVISVNSNPPGAKVKVRGITICASTPCDGLEITAGSQPFEFTKDRYRPEVLSVEVERGMKPVVATLKAMFGWLTVKTTPSGVPVLVDGKAIGNSPIDRVQVDPGRHKVEVGDVTWVQQWKEFDLAEGESKDYDFRLQARQGGIKVRARTSDDKAVEGKVFVDGVESGVTGKAFAVKVGTHEVEVRSDKGSGKQTVTVKEAAESEVTVKVEGGGGSVTAGKVGIEWVHSRPARLEFAKTETTVGQYRACVNAGGCESKHHGKKSDHQYCNWGYSDRDNHPMNCVDGYGADAFCKWAGGRLPTEEEWAAEASNGGKRVYPWGDEEVTCRLAIWGDGSNTDGCGENHTWPVCSKTAGNSVSGVCDLSGNVWEWTSSGDSSARVVRGGSWLVNNPEDLRAAGRGGGNPDDWDYDLGFRCVRVSRD